MADEEKFSSHIKKLRQKHRKLDEEIKNLGKYPDQAELKRLKCLKLKLKEQILATKRLLATASAGSTAPEPKPQKKPESAADTAPAPTLPTAIAA